MSELGGQAPASVLAPAPNGHGAGRARRALAIGSLIVLGIGGAGGGGTLLLCWLTRPAARPGLTTASHQAPPRWQQLPAGHIFPVTARYVSAEGITQSARRIGIAPPVGCSSGLDAAASRATADLGCTIVLRATYADQSGTLVATVGVAVLASPRAAEVAIARIRSLAGIKPVAFGGTIADLFSDPLRTARGMATASGRYILFYTAGYTDGEPGSAASGNPDLVILGKSLVAGVRQVLAEPGNPGRTAAPPDSAAPSSPSSPSSPSGRSRPSWQLPPGAGAQISSELASAWRVTTGAGVVVAVLDTGVAGLEGLSGRLVTGPDYAPVANPVLTDGTVLAALIAGRGTGRVTPTGPYGRAPAAKILSLRIVAYGSATPAALRYQRDGVWQQIEAKAIRYATDHGASVIVCAESGVRSTPGLAAAVAYAISRDAVVITAGFATARDNGVLYPDALPGVINVSEATVPGLPMTAKPGHSPGNFSVLVTAPANDLFAIGPADRVYIGSNNDSAIAWAAGAVALIKSGYPRMSPALIGRALASSASYRPASGYDTQVGFGLINPIGALRAAGQLARLRMIAAPGPGVVSPGSHFSPPGAAAAIGTASRSPAEIAGFGAILLAGLALLALAAWLARRRRHAGEATP